MDIDTYQKYKPWFRAAAVYNLLWGLSVIFYPAFFFQLLSIKTPENLAIWQTVGMCVLVYAPGYWWLSIDPVRFRHYVLIGLLGKTLGPIGFIWAASSEILPWRFFWINLFNDLIWLPVFTLFALKVSREHNGFFAMVKGN